MKVKAKVHLPSLVQFILPSLFVVANRLWGQRVDGAGGTWNPQFLSSKGSEEVEEDSEAMT